MASASCLARTGLVGHPSDGYGGATLAVALHNFAAHVDAEPAAALDIAPACEGQWPEGGRPLIAAAIARFAREHPGFDPRVAIRYRSTIPRQLGLGGSSALVIATLRALAGLAGTPIPDARLPALALAVEADELGIAAGLQDRVVQTFGGLVFMDFARERYEPLAATLLPALFVAWRPDAGGASGSAHASVRARFEQGDRTVVAAMATLGRLAHDARAALEAADHDGFAAALDAGYDVRARIFDLDPRHTELIDAARALGLHATYTGSGGAVAGIAREADAITHLAERLRPLGAHVARADVAAR
jgi:glucuronokinase